MRLKRKLLAAAICLALSTGHGLAMPTGGSVVTGDGNISGLDANPTSGAVIQFTGNGVINWHEFNIGANESLTFNVVQDATAFNYVSGGDISTILGQLTQSGGGSMVLCNPNGIIIGNGAVINANDLTLMTMQLDNDQLKNIFSAKGENFFVTAGKDASGNLALIDIQSGAKLDINTALHLYGGRIAIADGVFVSSGDAARNDGIANDNVHVVTGDAMIMGYDDEAKALKVSAAGTGLASSSYSLYSNIEGEDVPDNDDGTDSPPENDPPLEESLAPNPDKEEKNDLQIAAESMLNNPSYANIRDLIQKHATTIDEAYKAYNLMQYVNASGADEKKKADVMKGILENVAPSASAEVQQETLSVASGLHGLSVAEAVNMASGSVAEKIDMLSGPVAEEIDMVLSGSVAEEQYSGKEVLYMPDNALKAATPYNFEVGNSRLFGFDKNGEGFKLENDHKVDLPGKDTSLREAVNTENDVVLLYTSSEEDTSSWMTKYFTNFKIVEGGRWFLD